MKTAIEILSQYESFKFQEGELDETHYYKDNVLLAMEEYASQSKWVSVEEFIKAVKEEFPDMNLDYLNFINDRINKPTHA